LLADPFRNFDPSVDARDSSEMPWVDLETIVKNNQPTEREKRQVEEFALGKRRPDFVQMRTFRH
jgi:hypothetical protein